MMGSITGWGAVLFILVTVLRHSISGVKGASITPDERLSFLCDDCCSDIIDKASDIDPTNQLLVLTNQDANPLESLTELSIRAPCINATKALEVISDVPGMTLSLSGVSVDMRKLTEYSQPNVINAFAIDVKLSGGSLFDKPDIFAILGYPQILGVDRAPPGTWVWYTLTPKPYGGKSLLEFSNVEVSDPSSPLRITKELVLPRLLKVRAVAADGSPTSADVLGRSETELFNSNDNSVIPLCSSSIFVGVSGKLPVTCYRDARAEGKSWKYTIYMFAWDLKIVDFNDPNRVDAQGSNRTNFMDIYVGQEGDKSYFQLLQKSYNPNTLRAEGRLSPRSGDPPLPYPAESAYYLKFDIESPTKDRGSSFQAPTYWGFICIFYGPVNLDYESVTTDVSNGFLDSPTHTLDPDVLWLLTSCWTNLFKYPPYDTSFVPDLRRLIGFLQFDTQTVRDDYALASLVKLDNEVNTRYLLGQIPVTQLSLDIYQGTLLRYAETYQLVKLQTFNALNFNSAQRDRRTAAQVALEQTRNAESTAYAIYTRLRDRATDQRNAINDFYAIYQERNTTMAKNLDKFDEGIEGFIGQQSALLVLAILSAIFQVAAGVVKKEPWGAAQGAINAVKGIVDIVKIIKSVERLKELLDNLQGIWETFNVLFALENDATFIIERIEKALEKEDPNLFTAEDRKRLANGAFSYDLSGLQQALLNYTNVQLTASDIMSPAITNKVPGATGYTISLKEFANGGAFLLDLEVEYVDTLTQQIVAGVKYINTKVNTRAASKLLADIGADPLTLRAVNFNLFVQSYGILTDLLSTLDKACNAYTFAFVQDCPVPQDVRNGKNDDQLVPTINNLDQLFAELNNNDRLQAFTVRLDVPTDAISGLTQEGSATLNVSVEDRTNPFSKLYAVNVDSVDISFTGLRWYPNNAQVSIQIVAPGFQANKDRESSLFSFRGPYSYRGFVFAPGEGNKVIVPGSVYPGDAYKYAKPSVFTGWQFNVRARPFNYPTVCIDINGTGPKGCGIVDVSQVSAAKVTFRGRAGIIFGDYEACDSCPTCDNCDGACTNCTVVEPLVKDQCTNIRCHTDRSKCRKLVKNVISYKRELCALNDNFCHHFSV